MDKIEWKIANGNLLVRNSTMPSVIWIGVYDPKLAATIVGYAIEAEREACAQVADEHYSRETNGFSDHGSQCTIGKGCAGAIASAIRARSEREG